VSRKGETGKERLEKERSACPDLRCPPNTPEQPDLARPCGQDQKIKPENPKNLLIMRGIRYIIII
jgi:hypothetical protein